ncbi:hypothetical protein T492DRAFT_836973 [Pavlovales sp. CCMP2436]|nr:hypothetical protein T492DRAFT_836973 [Pavlovales sp. CCMP2436]
MLRGVDQWTTRVVEEQDSTIEHSVVTSDIDQAESTVTIEETMVSPVVQGHMLAPVVIDNADITAYSVSRNTSDVASRRFIVILVKMSAQYAYGWEQRLRAHVHVDFNVAVQVDSSRYPQINSGPYGQKTNLNRGSWYSATRLTVKLYYRGDNIIGAAYARLAPATEGHLTLAIVARMSSMRSASSCFWAALVLAPFEVLRVVGHRRTPHRTLYILRVVGHKRTT